MRDEDDKRISLSLIELQDTSEMIVFPTLEKFLQETSIVAISEFFSDSAISPTIAL